MRAILERCTVVAPALACAVRAAYSADLPTAGAAKEPGASSNCFASLWNWLNASVSDCPLTAHGFTVYGTLDVGYGYDTAGRLSHSDFRSPRKTVRHITRHPARNR